jgi:EAL domain-containing protein (putative c-di-GMP-specific phosphodiesterase class I)
MYEAIVRRLQLAADLRDAATDPAAAGFTLAFQPIVELDGAVVRGMEALLRWRHPQRGDTMPGEFVAIAEETGAIVPLGTWVLREALASLATWRRLWSIEGRDPDTLPAVGVNISGRQLQQPDFVARVSDALRRSGVPARQVTLEITESVIMQRTEETLATLRALRALGVRLAIDDFGTGYSSLSYLQKFPVDILKIDRAFVEGVARGGSDAALARTIIALGDTLGLRTVAEGVEEGAQADQLRALGCRLGQGYLFTPPLSASDAVSWLSARAMPAASPIAA